MLTAYMTVLNAYYALCCVSYKISALYILGLCLYTFLQLHIQPHILERGKVNK